MPTSFKVEIKDGGDDDDDEEDDDEIEVSHWLIAAYPIGTSCFLFQISMWSGLWKTLDCKKCLDGQLTKLIITKTSVLCRTMETAGFLQKRIYDEVDKSLSLSLNSTSVIKCCMASKTNKDTLRGTKVSYYINKLDNYNMYKERNQISNQN